MSQGATTASAAASYCRQARRLRWVYAGQPVRLHRSLCALARQTDPTGTARSIDSQFPVSRGFPPSPHAAFAQHVIAELDGPLLRYSQRQRLLRNAQAAGLRRFEANLVIALIEHRRRAHAVASPPSRRIYPWLLPVGLALMLQSVVAAFAYAIFG